MDFPDTQAALRFGINHCASVGDTALQLWPHLSRHQAKIRLINAVTDGSYKLDLENVQGLFEIFRAIGCHEPFRFFCLEGGYAVSHPVEPENQQNQAARQIDTQIEALEGLVKRVERIRSDEDDPKLRAVE